MTEHPELAAIRARPVYGENGLAPILQKGLNTQDIPTVVAMNELLTRGDRGSRYKAHRDRLLIVLHDILDRGHEPECAFCVVKDRLASDALASSLSPIQVAAETVEEVDRTIMEHAVQDGAAMVRAEVDRKVVAHYTPDGPAGSVPRHHPDAPPRTSTAGAPLAPPAGPLCEWCGAKEEHSAQTCPDPNWGRRCATCGKAIPAGERYAHESCQSAAEDDRLLGKLVQEIRRLEKANSEGSQFSAAYVLNSLTVYLEPSE